MIDDMNEVKKVLCEYIEVRAEAGQDVDLALKDIIEHTQRDRPRASSDVSE
jgi:translation initiation factor 2 alpha subunit (eIF-2alpha)